MGFWRLVWVIALGILVAQLVGAAVVFLVKLATAP